PGGSLERLMGHPITLGDASRILADVAAGLDAAHAAGLLHGDIKPANILRGESGWYLSDFGMAILAKAAHPLIRSAYRTPMPVYMSPEQAGGLTVTARSDVYALGALMYHLLGGRPPYLGGDPATIAARQAVGPPSSLHDLQPRVPVAVSGALMMALAANPDRRYGTAGQFAAAISDAVASTNSASLVLNERVAESTPAAASHEPAIPDDRRLLCGVCHFLNEPGRTHCAKCWSTLDLASEVEESVLADRAAKAAKAAVKRNAVVVFGAALALFACVLAYLLFAGGVPTPTTSVSALSAPGDWAMHQRDAQHTGFVSGPAPALTGRVRWQLVVNGTVYSSPVVVDGVLYVSLGDRRLVALDAASGAQRWETPVDGLSYGSPVVAGNLVIVALVDSRVLAFDRQTGDRVWVFRTVGPIYNSPLVWHGEVFIGTGNGSFHAIDAGTGHELWTIHGNSWISSSPAISEDGIVVFGDRDGNVHLVDAKTGRVRFRFRTVEPVEAPPTIVGKIAYVVTDNGSVFAVDLSERQRLFDRQWLRIRTQLWVWGMGSQPTQRGEIWSIRFPGRPSVPNAPAIANDKIYIARRDGRVIRQDEGTGKVEWNVKVTNAIVEPPTVVGDMVFVGGDDGRLRALDAATGQTISQWQAFVGSGISTSPVVAGDTVFVGATTQRVEVRAVQVPSSQSAAPGWYYRYADSPCTNDAPLHGPYEDEQTALIQGGLSTPACGVLYALQ
ncbi:MAG: PQQ-binding-like beta-propeller repeat protein, partial [Chloroflexi bacterium]|nr:PQQ-binding-like beta-propeller repeat protein [Chloroflexota bacterium]